MTERLGLALGSLLMGLGCLSAGLRAREAIDDPALAFVAGAAAASLAFALLAVAVACLSRTPLRRRLGLHRGRLPAAHAVLAVVGLVALSAGLHAAIQLTGLKEHSALPEMEARMTGRRGIPLVLLLLAVGLAPAVGEELLFRGAVLRGVLPRLGAPLSILLSSALFAFFHGDPVHQGAAVALGLYLGCVAWLDDGVAVAIAAHAANNLIGVLTPALGRAPVQPGVGVVVVGLGLGIGALLVAARGRRSTPATP